ncbi:hypothetical protein HPMG_01440 [Helicobacter pullorum MIT 98-5489]|uniref:DUF2971 domain-containing protein n=1 Tax=Helicobacter pullorum MIT 98-5489 TaxID=537972 RepID=C5F0H0_9HELI|nr:DUF2971 domain-containing protein [Helicobacter pullorum]EEQ63983.1 hypothetical protein HPMG_01440 [Helicobacter pullorum MIT 98-5489]
MEKKIEKEKWLGMQFSKFRELDNCENPAKTLTKRLKNYQKQTKSPYYRFWEILKKCELHMTNFEQFNDIDEGRYSFTEDSDIDAQNTTNDKNKRNICSFSYFEDLEDLNDRQCSETLMWAHYGGSHYGIRIDFKIHTSYKGNIYKIGYIESYEQDRQTYKSQKELLGNIERILTTKKPCFRYECEYRAISQNNNKLPIIIKKITLGRRFTKENVYSQENEEKSFSDDIKNLGKEILKVWKTGVKRGDREPEIWAYKTKYSPEPQPVLNNAKEIK